MRNKKRSFSFISSIILAFFLFTNISVPVQATTSNLSINTVSKIASTAIKVSASVNNKTPLQNSTINVTVNGPAKSSVKIVCHYKTTNTTYNATIGSNGKAVLPVRISRATKGYNVVINVTVTYKSKAYTTKTSFTPR